MKRKLRIEYDTVDGLRTVTGTLPQAIAFDCARAAAVRNLGEVRLIGNYGTAAFNHDGSGSVTWNENSTEPGAVTGFGPSTTVCIH